MAIVAKPVLTGLITKLALVRHLVSLGLRVGTQVYIGRVRLMAPIGMLQAMVAQASQVLEVTENLNMVA